MMSSDDAASYGDPQFSCAACGDTFLSKSSLLRHARRCPAKTSKPMPEQTQTANFDPQKTTRDSWECDICGVQFSRRYVLACHYRTHNGKKPYQCASCGEKFTWSVQLRLHAAKHPGELVFKCPNCDLRFKTSNELQKHSIVHPRTGVASVLSRPAKILRKRPYRRSTASTNNYCVICRKYFHKFNYLQNHWRAVHQGENSFECACCGAKFRWAMQLRVHATQHPNEPVFKCEKCEAKFLTQTELTKHKKIHPKYRYECAVCFEKFALLKEILIHSKRHTRSKCYKCSDCDRCFAQPHLLKRHSAGHDPARNDASSFIYDEPGQRYHCGICRVCFSRSELLAAHIKQHLNPRPHQCEWCGKCFQRADNLRCHIRIHTGEKPYRCEYCPKGFKESGQLVKHRRIHTGEKPYICESCGKAFTDSSKVKKHIRSMHSGPNREKKARSPRRAKELVSVSNPSAMPSSSTTVQYTAPGVPPPVTVNDLGHPIPYECGLCYQQFLDSSAIISHMETHTGGSTSCVFLPNGESGRSLARSAVQLLNSTGRTSSDVPHFDADIVHEFFQQQEQILAGTTVGVTVELGSEYQSGMRHTVQLVEGTLSSIITPEARSTPAGISVSQKLNESFRPVLNDESVMDSASLMPTSELTRSRPKSSRSRRSGFSRKRSASVSTKSCQKTTVPKESIPEQRRDDFFSSLDAKCDPDDLFCDYCSEQYRTKLLLLQHKATHTDEKPFACQYCSEKFSVYVKLVNHALTHEEYDKKCLICRKSFDIPAKLLKHTRYHMSQSHSKCSLCQQTFTQSISLEEHMRSAHSSAEPHQCEHCGKFFKLKANLDSHVRTHTGEKPFGPCEYCGKFFREMGQFKKHIRIHNGDRPYQCPYCPKAFVDSTKRKRHCRNIHKDLIE